MKFLLFTLTALSAFACTGALKCYVGTISNVNNPLNVTMAGVSQQDCYQNSACSKKVTGIGNNLYNIVRECATQCYHPANNQPMGMTECQTAQASFGTQQTTHCCCQGELCNSSSSAGVSILLVFMLFAWNLKNLF
ncbi:hypothetical protein L596_028663 [Steinernema carpocapsae]|uniref:UPAR/Ly6 domain-containing protein n=1 Tax=Steinernema carpocapsae TaxID=34508 RepID=A0A4U5LZ35_STECR|nr:hypothetical protein L596_028663 [Steinernema carpocapsae]